MDAIHANWEGIESALGDFDDALAGCGAVGGLDRGEDGFGVGDVGAALVLVGDGSESCDDVYGVG